MHALRHLGARVARFAILVALLPSAASQAATVGKPWIHGPPTDDAWFPIGVWLQDPKNATRYREAGVNLFIGLWNGPTAEQLDRLREAGMKVVCAQNPLALSRPDDPTIVGWMHGDEPDNAQSLPNGKGYGPPILPETIRLDYERLRQADPTRPILLNLGQGVAWDDYIGRGVRRNHPEDYPRYVEGADIVSFDIYPAVHDHPAVAGKLEFVARGVERLVGWAGPQRTVWNCIECTRISNPKTKPTPAQVRAEVWMALIHGSRGLIYFVHQFKPAFREAALLDDPEMLAAITAINRQVHDLAPILHSPTLADRVTVESSPAGTRIACMRKRRGNAEYLFAVNLGNQEARATFESGAWPGPNPVEVIDESRSIAPKGGRFEDAFGPYAVHLYVVHTAP